MANRNEFHYEGKLVEKDANGTTHTVLNQDNVSAGDGIGVSKSGDNVSVSLDIGVSVVNGMLCATFVEEETAEEE